MLLFCKSIVTCIFAMFSSLGFWPSIMQNKISKPGRIISNRFHVRTCWTKYICRNCLLSIAESKVRYRHCSLIKHIHISLNVDLVRHINTNQSFLKPGVGFMRRKLTESVVMNEVNMRLQQTSESHVIGTTCLCNSDNCHSNFILFTILMFCLQF